MQGENAFFSREYLAKGACMAPMAGVADGAFREICTAFGAVFTVTEMVSAKALCFQDKKSRELLEIRDGEKPCGVQLFGSEPETMSRAAAIAAEYKPAFIDINMGCPVPKVAGNGCGAALMRDLVLAGEIISATVEGSGGLPVTVKTRSGWDSEHSTAVELSAIAEKNGAAALVIHGRTKAQGYAPPVDLDIIKAVKKSVSIPVIGNGGIHRAADAAAMLEYTNCDGVMVAQGALGNPFIFEQISALLNHGRTVPPPDISRRLEVMLRHCRLICERRGEKHGILDARKHAAWYIKGVSGAAEFRRRAVAVASVGELERLAADIYKAHISAV